MYSGLRNNVLMGVVLLLRWKKCPEAHTDGDRLTGLEGDCLEGKGEVCEKDDGGGILCLMSGTSLTRPPGNAWAVGAYGQWVPEAAVHPPREDCVWTG